MAEAIVTQESPTQVEVVHRNSVSLTVTDFKADTQSITAGTNIKQIEVGVPGFQGPKGDNGVAQRISSTSSTTAVVSPNVTRTFVLDTPLDLSPGDYIKVTRTGSSSNANYWMSGPITAISPTSVTILTDAAGLGGSFSGWRISVGGSKGSTGAAGADGAKGDSFRIRTTSPTNQILSNTFNGASRTFALDQPLDLAVGQFIRVWSTVNGGNQFTGTITAISSTELTMTVNGWSGNASLSSWNVSMAGVTGNQGIQGVQGIKGDTGAQGPIGPDGVQGPQGTQGVKGDAGSQGLKGDTGETGLTGATGPKGADSTVAGPQGITGAKGDKGDTGTTGAKGDQGIQGIQGVAGAVGAQGATGPQGVKGDQGNPGVAGPAGQKFRGNWSSSIDYDANDLVAYQGSAWFAATNPPLGEVPSISSTYWFLYAQKGDQGVQGIQGNTGATGNTGSAGPQGIQGVKGDTGAAGAAGAKGDTGSQGIQGVKGDQGIQGVAGVKGDTGATGATGPKGDTGNQGIQGIKGDTGSQGIQGIAGSKGDTGDQGTQGETGPQGLDGAQGPKGDTGAASTVAGPQGPQGLKGDTGTTGATGAKGDTGTAGAKGDTGSQGIQGIQGLKGDTGTAGTNGTAGATGPKGDTGTAGAQGIQGIQGVKGDTGTRGSKWYRPDASNGYYHTGITDAQAKDNYLANDGFIWEHNGTEFIHTGQTLKGEKGDIGATGPAGKDGGAAPVAENRLTRQGSVLKLDGVTTRLAGPNAYWLALNDNVLDNGLPTYPTSGVVNQTLDAAKAMGANSVRVHTIGISLGKPRTIMPTLDTYDAVAFDKADYIIAAAKERGLLLSVPLTDRWDYYHGGAQSLINMVMPNGNRQLYRFWSEQTVRDAFDRYVTTLLNHVNPYTGLRWGDDPTLAMWEIGNEFYDLRNEQSSRDRHASIAALIKTLAPKALVVDGTGASGGRTIDSPGITDPNVDILTNHYYQDHAMDLNWLPGDATAAANANKVFMVGEYDWTDGNNGQADQNTSVSRTQWLGAIESNPNIAGDYWWTLMVPAAGIHRDKYELYVPPENAEQAAGQASFTAHSKIMVPAKAVSGANVFVQSTKPTSSGPYLWVETNVGYNGDGFTFWIEDGK